MTKTKKQSFMYGAVVLVVASILVKVIGAVFKIPLANLIEADGMGLFGTSYTIYTFMFVIATAGFPVAVSKLVAESAALGNHREAKRIFYVASVVLCIIGVIGSAVLYLFAQPLADALKNSRAALGIMAMSPAVFCVALTSSYRGYFQGYQNMYPTAISQVIEALCKLIIGYTLAKIFLDKSVELAAAGAIFGVSLGTFLGLLSLVISYKRDNKKPHNGVNIRSYREVLNEIIKIAVPITIGASVASLTNLIDVATVMGRLQTINELPAEAVARYASLIDMSAFSGGVDEKLANSLYGLYTGYAVPLFNLPFTVVVALAMSIVPAVSAYLAKGNDKSARESVDLVTRLTVLFALPCSAGLIVLSKGVLLLLYGSDTAHILLSEISASIVFVALLSITNAILQAYGKPYIPVINMLFGGVIKLLTNHFLVAIPSVNIEGAPIGTFMCYSLIVILNLIFIIRITGVRFSFIGLVVKPLFCTALMAFAVKTTYDLLINFGLRADYSSIPAIGVGVVAYAVLLLLTRALTDKDILMLPKGDRILNLIRKEK